MKAFMDKDFLLTTATSRLLYHESAADMPIVDYHCHVSPKEIYEDKRFENIAQVWLGGDHYKWRIMRSNGVEEYYITGGASDREKFQKFAEALPRAIGNPMYHWCHLELKKYFGYNGILNGDTAEEVWNLANAKLREENMSVRGIIAQSNVAFIGTTDDPVDSLEWHEKLAADKTMKTTVAPSFRPDKALNMDKTGWLEYIGKLSEVSNVTIDSVDALKTALRLRMEHFAKRGCKASDHGLDYMFYRPACPCGTDEIFKKGLKGETVTQEEAEKLKTELLLFCAREYVRLGWVMQIHYNCLRNPNSTAFATLGADTGFDCIGPMGGAAALAKFLDALHKENALPKTILYSLDSGDNAFLDTLIGSFQGAGVAGKIQHGSAWWFNDNKQGMREQMISLANLSLLGNFVGMLTDSRSFLSYTRHEYFRRILCGLIGEWVENGEYPADMGTLSGLVKDICYHNAVKYFSLEEKLTMKMTFRWYGEGNDKIKLSDIKQIPGVEGIVWALHDKMPGEIWQEDEIAAVKAQCDKYGFNIDVVESVNVHDDIKIGLPTRDQYIENYKQTIRNLSKFGVKVICYNFMPIFDWTRSNLFHEVGDGSTALFYEKGMIQDDYNAMAKYILDFTEKYNMSFPGWEPERMAKLDELFKAYADVTKEKLWANLQYFLEAIMPTCRECDIKMAIHMDDPPWDIFGLPRLLVDEPSIDRFLKMVDDPYNCLTLCSGSLNANPNNNVAEIVRKHCDRIAFAHIRNVKHFENGDFSEASHRDCDGDTGILDILKAYHDCGFEGYIRPDHGRHLWNEGPGTVRPGYGLYDRALGIMYMLGVWDMLDKLEK